MNKLLCICRSLYPIPIWFILPVAIFLSGCSFQQIAIKSLVGSGEHLADTYLTEDDPQLVREAMPSNLKMIEMLLNQSPDNPDLLLTASKSFTMYAYAFIQQDADRMAVKDIHKAKIIRKRLEILYRRAKNYGLKGLEVKYPGFDREYNINPQKVLSRIKSEDVPFLYWTAVAWGGLISSTKANPEAIVDFPNIGYFLERCLELDEDFDNGALHQIMISYVMSLPDAGNDAEKIAREHFERAVEISYGNNASVYVSFAETVAVKSQNRDEFLSLLDQALKIDVDKNPSTRLANIIAQQRARWLKDRMEELFF
ncbi:MAG: TRAP transporter TatT component family protein [Candidatus Marinimicrobia bacterium]|nr:TRAP transporter TatT component family protein [Candidatus Neomarinimicrobiota bacterium]